MNQEEMLKKVNPTYLSAKGVLILLSKTGDSDIMCFYNDLDKEALGKSSTLEPSIIRSWRISLEARYNFWTAIAEETDCEIIVDLPCGYLPQCLKAARLNKKYYGLDLPIVTEEVSRIAFKHLDGRQKNLVQYHGVDATNYDSLRNALKDAQGKICIITDGFLGYFNLHDLKAICENVYRLLREFGGHWYTSDSQFPELMELTHAVITGDESEEMSVATSLGATRIADSNLSDHLFMGGTLEERRKFMEECGFSVKSFRYTDKLRVIPSLKENPALMEKLLSAYNGMEEWVLTAKETPSAEKAPDIPFAQEFSSAGGVLSIRISGRLDTITAPEFLQKVEELRAKNSFTEIKFDAANLSYISYAGVRALQILQESCSSFRISSASGEVRKILTENFPAALEQ